MKRSLGGKAAQSLWMDLKPTLTWRKIFLIGVQRLYSFITPRFHTPPQVILNQAIHQLHLPSPSFPLL